MVKNHNPNTLPPQLEARNRVSFLQIFAVCGLQDTAACNVVMAGLVPAIPMRDPRGSPSRDRRDEPGDDIKTWSYRSRTSYADFLFCRLFTKSSTTPGSASVEVSPRLPDSSSA